VRRRKGIRFFYVAEQMVRLHRFIARAAGAFRGGPADVVKGAFPLAGLAVQTVGGIGGFDLVVYHLIDARRAKRDARPSEFRRAFFHANAALVNQ
jgi:hypothetical protein